MIHEKVSMNDKTKLNIGFGVNDNFGVTGILGFTIKDKQGNIIETFEDKNIIVDFGRYAMTRLLGEPGNDFYINRIGFGIGTDPASPSDTDLVSPTLKSFDSINYPSVNIVQYNWSLSESELVGVNITEFGLYTWSGNLFSKKVRSAISKDEDFSISGYWRIVF